MSSGNSITRWISKMKEGDSAAAQKLWETYFQQMVDLARRRLQGANRRAADEEDVALSAFKSFCMGAPRGRFPKLTDRNSLWPLLVSITAHKSIDLIRRENRKKRGGAGGSPDQLQNSASAKKESVEFDQLISAAPSPEFIAQINEELEHLLKRLDETGDSDLRRIALLKMSGESIKDIAAEVGCSRRSIERKLPVIMRIWEENQMESSS